LRPFALFIEFLLIKKKKNNYGGVKDWGNTGWQQE
jgi:hypothetical protein